MSGTLSQDLFKAISIHGLVQERRNSIANALELCLSCTKPSITIWNLCESWRFSLSFLLQCWHGSSRNPHFNILWMTSVNIYENCETFLTLLKPRSWKALGWVGLWGYLWWAPSGKRKDHHGSALDGTVSDITQILAYLVHNMSRSQLYLGFGHFGWLPSFFGQ